VLSASLPPNQSPDFGIFLAKPVDLDRLHRIIRAQLSNALSKRVLTPIGRGSAASA